jgi:hypothetical protein
MTKSQHALVLDTVKHTRMCKEQVTEMLQIDIDSGSYDMLSTISGSQGIDTFESYKFFANIYLKDESYFNNHLGVTIDTHPELFI